MTNHWNDIANSDVIMVIGSNAAENHPVSFKYVTNAMNNPNRGVTVPGVHPRGATLIVVDPRFTRTASRASQTRIGSEIVPLYLKMRSGTDIAFMLGMMKYAIDHGRLNWQYLRDCTNASFLLDPGFQTCRQLNPDCSGGSSYGVFSGLVPDPRRHKKCKYDTTTWAYQYTAPNQIAVDRDYTGAVSKFWNDDSPGSGIMPPGGTGTPDPNSVWAKFVEHVSAYDPVTVAKITGGHHLMIEKIYEVYTATALDHKSACIMYAMGSTQHTYGSQNVRSYAMMQLLLGNAGVAGGGINALRGESNVQGSTDMCLLWHILPGYLAVTNNSWAKRDRAAYKNGYSSGKAPQDPDLSADPVSLSWWKFGGKYIDSLLQAWWPKEHMPGYTPGPDPNFGDVATMDKAYHHLPKARSDFWYTHE